jgi:hypothetical protein
LQLLLLALLLFLFDLPESALLLDLRALSRGHKNLLLLLSQEAFTEDLLLYAVVCTDKERFLETC